MNFKYKKSYRERFFNLFYLKKIKDIEVNNLYKAL